MSVSYLLPKKTMDIELTERCNNRCIHCCVNQPEDDPALKSREMDTAFVKSLLKQAAERNFASVRFTGGEPLLRDDFVELYLYARSLGLAVILFTNARLLTSDLAKLFSERPPRRPVEVTIYGMSESTYNVVAGQRGAFQEFWRGIHLLKEYDVPFVVKLCILPQNRHELPIMEAFSRELPSMKDKVPDLILGLHLRSRRDSLIKNQTIKRLRLSPQEIVNILTRDPERYIASNKEFVEKFMKKLGDRIFSCGAGKNLYVDAYGQAKMCASLQHPEMQYPLSPEAHYRINPQSELSAFDYVQKEFFPEKRKLHSQNPAFLQRCAICFLGGGCNQCAANSWSEHGTLDTPVEYFCEIAHAEAVYLGLLREGEKAWLIPPAQQEKRIADFLEKT